MKENAIAAIPGDLAAWHFLSRTTFGPRPQDMQRAKEAGIASILEGQLHPENIDDSAVEQRISALPTLTMSPEELMEDFPAPKKAKIQAEKRALTEARPAMTPDQLEALRKRLG